MPCIPVTLSRYLRNDAAATLVILIKRNYFLTDQQKVFIVQAESFSIVSSNQPFVSVMEVYGKFFST
jgi:hypothetical protein